MAKRAFDASQHLAKYWQACNHCFWLTAASGPFSPSHLSHAQCVSCAVAVFHC